MGWGVNGYRRSSHLAVRQSTGQRRRCANRCTCYSTSPSLLAWLVLHADQPAPKEHLAFLLWPESSGAQARTNLRQLLHHLRRAFPEGSSLLRVDHSTVQWRRDACCTIDVIEFASLVDLASEAKQKDDAESELQALRRAARLYVDDVMPAALDAWLVPVRQAMRTQLSGALLRLASLVEKSGDLADAMTIAERLVGAPASCEQGPGQRSPNLPPVQSGASPRVGNAT